MAKRQVGNGTCTACIHEAKVNWLRRKGWDRAGVKRWREENPEKVKAWSNKNRRALAASSAGWRARNPKAVVAQNALRRASECQATPRDKTLRRRIREIYEACPVGMHVDHVIPLRGRNVCGWHHPNNLAYLDGPENLSKSNIFDPTRWPEQGRLAAP